MSGTRAATVDVGFAYPTHKQSDEVSALTITGGSIRPCPLTPRKEKMVFYAYPTPSSSPKKKHCGSGGDRVESPTPQARSHKSATSRSTSVRHDPHQAMVIDVDSYISRDIKPDVKPDTKPEINPRMMSPPLKSIRSGFRRGSTTTSSVPEERLRTQQYHLMDARPKARQRAGAVGSSRSGPAKAALVSSTISSSAESSAERDIRAFQKVTSDWSSCQRDDLQAYIAEVFDKEMTVEDLPASLEDIDIDDVKRAVRSLFRHLSNFVDLASEE